MFGITPATVGRDPDRRQAGADRAAPPQAKRHGIAYVPEDRGSQGVIRPMTLRENVSLAVLRRIARHGFIDRAGEEVLATDAIARFAHPRARAGAGRGQAVGRQPAEGRARQVAGDQAARC